MAEQRLYYGGSSYGYTAYGTMGFTESELEALTITGKAIVTIDGTAESFLDSLVISGNATVTVNGVREVFGELTIVGKATLTSTISFVTVVPSIEVFHREDQIVITVGGKTAEISIQDMKEGRIKPAVAVSQPKPKMSVISHTSEVAPLHRGAEITYQIERSEEFIYAD